METRLIGKKTEMKLYYTYTNRFKIQERERERENLSN